jgi:uncharacterized protein
MQGKKIADTLIKSLKPSLHEGVFVFCNVAVMLETDPENIICSFREEEGITLILRRENADKLGLSYSFSAAWITLKVHSSLQSVGLTAAFAQALTEKGISCNVVAGYHHDHLFVPREKSAEAMKILNRLSWNQGRNRESH